MKNEQSLLQFFTWWYFFILKVPWNVFCLNTKGPSYDSSYCFQKLQMKSEKLGDKKTVEAITKDKGIVNVPMKLYVIFEML